MELEMTNNDELMFSVEVATYNQKEFIAQTLQSIIEQDHNYKYEILVSDDCSTDGTQEIIKELHTKYPEIIKPIYNEKNLGAMKNYYSNISRAKGKYLMGCGGDDYWLPGKVKKQIEFMEQNPGFCFCYSRAYLYKNDIRCYDGFSGTTYVDKNDILLKGNCVSALTTCIRMNFYKKYLNEIKPQDKDWLMEDYPFNIYSFFESFVYYMSEPLAVYRVINGSLCHQINPKKQFIFEKSTYEIRQFFAQKYNIDIEIKTNNDLYNIVKKSYSVNKKELKSLRKELGLHKENKFTISKLKRIIKNILPFGFVNFLKKNHR